MAIHVSELNIETYRGIKALKLENFASVNIITGDNNCGKTSVLERTYQKEFDEYERGNFL